MSKNTTNYSMKAFIISLIIVLSVSGFAQNKSALSSEAKMLLDTYYPGNNALHKKVNDFYDSLSNCHDTNTVNWLFNEQDEISYLLSESFDVDYKNDSNLLYAALIEAEKQLNITFSDF